MSINKFFKFTNEPYDGDTCVTALINCFTAICGHKKMKSSDLIEAICKKEISWATYNKGNPITSDQLDSLLKVFGIKSRKIKFRTGKENGFYGKCFSNLLEVIDKPPKSKLSTIIAKPTTMVSMSGTYSELCLIALLDCAKAIECLKKIKSTEIAKAICLLRNELWATYDNGLPITTELLDSMLTIFGIKSENIEFNDGFEMGYYGNTFSEKVTLVSELPELDNPTVTVCDYELMIFPRVGSVKPLY